MGWYLACELTIHAQILLDVFRHSQSHAADLANRVPMVELAGGAKEASDAVLRAAGEQIDGAVRERYSNKGGA